MTDISRLIRPAIREMQPYTPIVPFEVLSEQLGFAAEKLIKLDANENPYGPPPAALEALQALDATVPIYPDPEARKLRAGLAAHLGIDAAHILVSAGADDLILLLTQLFLGPGDALLDCPPTFSMYAFDAALVGAEVLTVPRRPDYSLDIPAVEEVALASGAKLLFLSNPNNPDGSVLDRADVLRLLKLPLVVVVDEAYIAFSDSESMALLVPEHRNLVVLQTFSKWAGLAGLRVGYGVFSLDVMEHLWKIKQPYTLNVAADAAAQAALGAIETLNHNAECIRAERRRLMRELRTIPYLRPYPSQANFILCRVVGRDAAGLKNRLAQEHGILIRHFNKPGLRDHVRISVGKPAHSDILLNALRAIAEEA